MSTKYAKGIVLSILLVLAGYNTFAQSDTSKYQPIDFNLQVKNMHLWRGLKVTNAAMTDVDIHYITKDGSFKAGVWGGAGFTGVYKEFDYYVSYAHKGFTLAVWDINNFSNNDSAKIFDYKRATTTHFIDVTAAYAFGKKMPMKFSWSTIVQGRDTVTNNAGKLVNVYSNYLQFDCQVWQKDDVKFILYAGGAFAFGRQENFYGSKPNFTNVGFLVTKNLKIFNYVMPASAMAGWNPEKNYGAVQVALNLF
ncbi:hypothetical protein ACI6Q2_10760 [Chitinophagaceae bacterium LWZ2-11]